MTIHLLKIAVGITDVDQLRHVQRQRLMMANGRHVVRGYTRRMPRRRAEVIFDGSIYWIVKGFIQARQRILDMVEAVDDEGRGYCQFHYSPELVATEAVPRRPMQGWRYLTAEDAPRDLGQTGFAEDGLPLHLVRELRALGLA